MKNTPAERYNKWTYSHAAVKAREIPGYEILLNIDNPKEVLRNCYRYLLDSGIITKQDTQDEIREVMHLEMDYWIRWATMRKV